MNVVLLGIIAALVASALGAGIGWLFHSHVSSAHLEIEPRGIEESEREGQSRPTVHGETGRPRS